MKTAPLAAAASFLALVAAGCGNGERVGVATTTTSSSTTSTSTTTTTTTTTSPTTTSTTLEARNCDLTLRLADDVTAGALQWSVHYGDAGGDFVGAADSVECASLVEGTLAAFNDIEAERRLSAGLIALAGIDGPVNIAECLFRTPGVPRPEDFEIAGVSAADLEAQPIVPAPAIVVSAVSCDPGDPDGPSTTTTTFPTTTTTLPLESTVTIRLSEAAAALGALQVRIDYGDAPGAFAGSGATVDCTNLVQGSLFAGNDDEAGRALSAGWIALTPFDAPRDLARCTFGGDDAGDPPVADDFDVTIEDAADGDGKPVDVTVAVLVEPAPAADAAP